MRVDLKQREPAVVEEHDHAADLIVVLAIDPRLVGDWTRGLNRQGNVARHAQMDRRTPAGAITCHLGVRHLSHQGVTTIKVRVLEDAHEGVALGLEKGAGQFRSRVESTDDLVLGESVADQLGQRSSVRDEILGASVRQRCKRFSSGTWHVSEYP